MPPSRPPQHLTLSSALGCILFWSPPDDKWASLCWWHISKLLQRIWSKRHSKSPGSAFLPFMGPTKYVHLLCYIWLPKWLWFLFHKPIPSSKHFMKTISIVFFVGAIVASCLWLVALWNTLAYIFTDLFVLCCFSHSLVRSSEFSLTLNLCNCPIVSFIPSTDLVLVSLGGTHWDIV